MKAGRMALGRVGMIALIGMTALSAAALSLSRIPVFEKVTIAGHRWVLPSSSEVNRTLLPDGRLFEIHGADGFAYVIDDTTRRVIKLPEIRRFASVTVMPTGQVLLWGGVDARGDVLNTGEWFEPTTERFVRANALGLPARAGHTLTVLTDGQLLMTGGWSANGIPATTALLWQPASRQVTVLSGEPDQPRLAANAELLADGTVRIDGGVDAKGQFAHASWYFDPMTGALNTGKPPASIHAGAAISATFPSADATAAPIQGPFVVRFAAPVDVRQLRAHTITLLGPEGAVPVHMVGAEGGRLAFVQLPDDLFPGSRYTLFVQGLHTTAGAAIPYTAVGFTTAGLSQTGVAVAGRGHRPTPDANADQASALPPLYLAAGGGDVDCANHGGHALCRDHSFVREGAWYPGQNNAPNASGAHWRLYQPHQSLPDTHALEATLTKGTTALIGQVRQIDETPVANVNVSVGNLKVKTDAQGVFVLTGLPAGRQEVFVDGRSASHGDVQYGRFLVGADIKAKTIGHMPFVMYLPRVLPRDEIALPSPTTREVVLTHPEMPGLELHIPAGTVFKDHEGHVLTHIAIVPTPVDHAPFPLPDNFPMYFTIQPGDAVVQGLSPEASKGIRVVYPNYGHEKANTPGNFWVYDIQKGWQMYGGGHVTADAQHLAPDPGVSLVWAIGAGASLGSPNGSNNMLICNATRSHPIDLQTGIFFHEWDDFSIRDIMPLTLTRAYNSADTYSHMFGVGGNSNYGIRLFSANGFITPQLMLPCGQGVAFNLASGIPNNLNGDVWVHTGTDSAFFGATLQHFSTSIGEYWQITRKDGTAYGFQSDSPNLLLWVQDRFGNQMQMTYNGGLLERVTSSSGRSITFNYGSGNSVTSAVDNTGRTISYTYNSSGTLSTVTYPDQTTEHYTYDSANQLLTMQDRRGHVWVTNQYDANGRVTKQTLADQTYYQFAYTADSSNNVTATTVTDPNGNQERVAFDPVSRYPSSLTEAYGTSLAQTTTFQREPSGLIDSRTDALGRTTAFAYDALGNVTSVTRLSGTTNAVTTHFTYTSDYNQLASVTDPLGHTISLSYINGCLTQITDALGHSNAIQCNSAGQPTSIQDALGHTVTLAYQGYDLQSVTDPLNRVTNYVVDALGRRVASRDPLGNVTLTQYDNNDRVTAITDPLNQTTTETYDGNGNQLTVTLPNQGVITSAYDNRNRRVQRIDALNQAESWTYDGMGNMLSYTDRKHQVTLYSYDALNRRTLVSYADGSGIQATYDAGNRLTGLTDSSSGSYSWAHDGLNRVTSAVAPMGTISYGYDAASRLVSMTPAAQATVNYSYDAADRLTSLSQGSETVQFTYDAADRRSTLVLPNGIVVGASFDAASELTSLTYTQSNGTSLGSLTYGYDADGRIVSKSGTFATDLLPTATTQPATFDLNDRKTSFNGQALTYDANGNLTSDGTNTYTWNARNQLTQISQGSNVQLSFSYDALGRRIAKTVGSGTPTQYLYDGANVVQETQGSSVNPVLNGLGIDERFARNDITGRTYYLADILRSTVALTDSAGTIRQQYSYDPYGNTEQSDTTTGFTNPYQYTGREADAPGLYFYRARYYSSLMGGFISQDKLWFGGGQSSFYAYAGGDPVDHADSNGLGGPISGPRVPSSFSWRRPPGAGGSYGQGVGGSGDPNSNDPEHPGYTAGAWGTTLDIEYTQVCVRGYCPTYGMVCPAHATGPQIIPISFAGSDLSTFPTAAVFDRLYPGCTCTKWKLLDQTVTPGDHKSDGDDARDVYGKILENKMRSTEEDVKP